MSVFLLSASFATYYSSSIVLLLERPQPACPGGQPRRARTEADSSIDSVVNTYLIEHCGLKPTDPNPSEPIGLVVASNCNYFSSLEFPGVVDLGLRVSKLGKSSVTYEVGFFKEGVDSVSAVGGFTHVFVHPTERRPTSMVDTMRKGLEKLYVEEAKL